MARSTVPPARDDAILVEGISKDFGSNRALDDINLVAPRGQVLGILGPNGAGKTTLVRILATLLPATSGRALVDGHDVVTHPHLVRRTIGLTGQYASVDEKLSGRDNLYMIARLLDLSTKAAWQRTDELLARFSLTDAARRKVSEYSGGMRRRIDLAASLVGRPRVLYLDEPTTGLDPRSRNAVWDEVRQLTGAGATVVLTTQYMEEAEALADNLAVIDQGRLIASGTPADLKARIGGRVQHVRPADPRDLPTLSRALRAADVGDIAELRQDADGYGPLVSVTPNDDAQLTAAVAAVAASGVQLAGVHELRPSLDEVFLKITGRPADHSANVEATEGAAR